MRAASEGRHRSTGRAAAGQLTLPVPGSTGPGSTGPESTGPVTTRPPAPPPGPAAPRRGSARRPRRRVTRRLPAAWTAWRAPVTTRPDPADADGGDWAARALRTLAGASVVAWAFRLSGYLTLAPWLAAPVAALGLTGLLVIVTGWLPGAESTRMLRRADWAVLAAALAGLALWSYFQVYISPDYGTDEIAFDQYAAQLALHGINPYLHSMAAAFPLFHVSPNGYTFQLNGHPVASLSYPALSFEAYLPVLALGATAQAAVWVDVAAWAAGAVVLFAVLPRRLAPLVAVVASMDVFIGYAVGGVTDFLFVPLLVGAAVRWDTFGTRRGPAAWRGPVLLGLAMAVKQTPWLAAPFVLAGIVAEARGRGRGWAGAARDGLRYAGLALAAFCVPNLPYLVQAPGAWLRGILIPFSSHAVPAGQGLVSLSLSIAVGGGSLRAFSTAALVVFAAVLACYLAAYPVLKPTAFLLPSLALFFATRSFGSYLVMLLPAAIAAAATTTRPPGRCSRYWAWVAGVSAAACAAAVAMALTAASPLQLAIRAVRTTGQLATVQQVTLAVSNVSGQPVRPAFTIENGSSMTAFWRRLHGPAVLGPHKQAQYTIVAPSYFAMPSIGTGFQVLAFAQDPASVSRTSAYVGSVWRVVLQPATINHPVYRGQEITVHAEIVNRLDQPMRVANVPVYLGQVIYDQRGLEYSEAVINSAPEGRTPVEAFTNAEGVATFTIGSAAANIDPVYFEANLVKAGQFYPYGYSPILAIRFRS